MKIVKSIKQSGLLMKDIPETMENEAKKQRVDFLVCY